MPHAPVYGMTFQEHFNDLVISTYGRGIYILDDLSPLQKMTSEIAAQNAYLFAPRAAYRWEAYNGNVNGQDDPTTGQNPPPGAGINYWLKSAPQSATVTILDASGKTVRTMTAPRQAGLNRIYWDFTNEPSKQPRMRTKPTYDAEFTMDADGTRAAPGFGNIAVEMPPAQSTVRLTVDGTTLTQPLTVLKDPMSRTPDTEIAASVAALLKLQAELNNTADMLNTIESARSQIQSLAASNPGIKASADSMEQKLLAVEAHIDRKSVV